MSTDNCSFLLADVTRLLRRNFKEQLKDSSLTLAQAKALKYVSRQEGVRQVDLADKLEVKPITIARLIDQLVELNLIERRPDKKDRRAHRIYLTKHATHPLTEIQKVGDNVVSQAMANLTPMQAKQFVESLNTIRETLLND